MRVATSYFFGSIVFCSIAAALSIAPAAGEAPNDSAAIETPWHKMCLPGVCLVSKSRRTYCGSIGEASLIERKAETGKRLRIGLPPHIDHDRAVRITIGTSEPVSRPISTCDKFVCWVDHDTGAELVDQLKQGQWLVIEAVNPDGTPYTVSLPLAGFAEAYDGPARPAPEVRARIASDSEMKEAREQQKRTDEERRARCGSSP